MTRRWSFRVCVFVSLLAVAARAHEPEGPPAEPAAEEPSDEAEVSVVGTRPAAPSPSATTITARQLRAFPHRTAEDALRLVPGVTLVQHGSEGKGYQLFVRGFDAVHGAGFAVSVLGIPQNEWSNVHAQGYVDLGFVMPEVISAVDVSKGPYSLQQGAFALAGSANYRLGLAAADTGLRVGATLGTTGRYRAVATYARPEAEGRDFVAVEATTDAGFGQNRAIEHASVLGLTEVVANPRLGRVSVLTAAHAAGFRLPGSLRDEDVVAGHRGFYDAYDDAQRGASERGLLGVLHEWQGAQGGVSTTVYGGFRRLELLENYTGVLVDPVQGDRRRQIQRTTQVGMNLEAEWDPVDALGVSTSVGAALDAFSQEQTHVGARLQNLERTRELAGTQLAAHVTSGAHFHPWTGFVVHAGMRLDLAHVDAEDALAERRTATGPLLHFSPRVALSYQPLNALELSAAYGRGFRPPEAQALVPGTPLPPGSALDGASATPGMTSIDSAELGIRYRTSRFLAVRLNAFGNLMTREVVYDHISGQNLEFNGTRRLGVEAGLSSNPLSFLTLAADVTWVDARFQESQNPIHFAPWLVGGLHAVATHASGLRGGLRVLAMASRALPHGAVGSPLATVDLTAGYRAKTWDLDLALENPFDLALREGESMFASAFPPGPPSALPARHFAAAAPRNARLTFTMYVH